MPKGFFEWEEKPITPRKVRANTIFAKSKPRRTHKFDLPPCEECKLHLTNKHPKMGITGEGDTRILILSEAQGRTEDERGYQLCGSAGQLFRNEVIDPLGYDLDKSFYKLNAVRCRPTDDKGRNRSPTDREIALCRDETWKIIREKSPIAIILAGRIPLQSYLMGVAIGGERPTMAQWADWLIPDRALNCWIIPQYHPSFFQYGTNKKLLPLYKDKIGKAIDNALRTFPKLTAEEEKVDVLTKTGDIESLLHHILDEKPDLLTIDWETTGLKPYATEHEIISVGLSWNPEHGVSFPLSQDITPLLLRVLRSNIDKTSHNFKFEELWSRVILGTEIKNWRWCSQLAAHVLDDRRNITSLEFQSFVRYGVVGFKDETNQYLKAETANGLNRIKECPLDKLLLRNGLDAMLANRLARDQMREIGKEKLLPGAFEFFKEGSLALLDTEMTGIYAPADYFTKAQAGISTDTQTARDRVMQSRYAKLWEKRTGEPLNPTSPDQLKKLLFDELGIKPLKFSAKGNPTLDKTDIEEMSRTIKHAGLRAFLSDITQLRATTKTESTYINGILREIYQDKLHPFFGLHKVRSYRGSSSRPNFQNIPVRNEKMMLLIRSGIFPHPGQRLLEIDYGMHEVRIAAVYSQDPVLMKYCKDSKSDMHRDQTEKIYLLNKKAINKPIRNLVKGAFVFAQFYGSWWQPCAEKLWKDAEDLFLDDGTPLREHLSTKGFRGLPVFEEHVRAEEQRFWKKFAVYAQWKEEWVKRYYKTGRVPMKHGFRRQGFLARNKILNTSIQGTAFHLLLWSLIEINKLAKKEGWKSSIIAQIHDCILMSVEPSELYRVMTMVNWIMSEAIMLPHPWLNVPLEVEFELCGIDQPWATKKKIDYQKFLIEKTC